MEKSSQKGEKRGKMEHFYTFLHFFTLFYTFLHFFTLFFQLSEVIMWSSILESVNLVKIRGPYARVDHDLILRKN